MKICSKCDLSKLESEFSFYDKEKSKRRSSCKVCCVKNSISYNKPFHI